MAPTSLLLLQLPGASSFVHGYYGLEECAVRGLVRIERRSARSLQIRSLRLVLKGALSVRFFDAVDNFDMVRREKELFSTTIELLAETEICASEFVDGAVCIPFEVPFPPHEAVTAGHGPALQLLPPTSAVFGQSSNMHIYQATTEYSLAATLVEAAAARAASMSGMPPAATNLPSTPPSVRKTFSGTETTSDFLSSIPAALFGPPVRTCSISIHPFLVYDPRMMPVLMHPDPRRWRSSPGAVPVEYDIEVGSVALGPGDPLRFAYRMVVNGDSARQGVRVRKVVFVLKETHIVGEDRCCSLDDRPRSYAVHKPPARVKGVVELLRWEHVEFDPQTITAISRTNSFSNSVSGNNSGNAAAASSSNGIGLPLFLAGRSSTNSLPEQNSTSNRIERSSSFGSSFYRTNAETNPEIPLELSHLREPQKLLETLSRPGTRMGANDGVYVENETWLRIPSRGGFTPTTAKPILPPDDAVCRNVRPRKAILQVRHSIQVVIDFYGADRISIESGVYLLSVGQSDCGRLLEIDPEIMPTLDYDKVVGIEVWVPEYERQDSLFQESKEESQKESQKESQEDLFHDAQDLSVDVEELPCDTFSDLSVPNSPTPRYEDVILNAPPPSEIDFENDSENDLMRMNRTNNFNLNRSNSFSKTIRHSRTESQTMMISAAHRRAQSESISRNISGNSIPQNSIPTNISGNSIQQSIEEAINDQLDLFVSEEQQMATIVPTKVGLKRFSFRWNR